VQLLGHFWMQCNRSLPIIGFMQGYNITFRRLVLIAGLLLWLIAGLRADAHELEHLGDDELGHFCEECIGNNALDSFVDLLDLKVNVTVVLSQKFTACDVVEYLPVAVSYSSRAPPALS